MTQPIIDAARAAGIALTPERAQAAAALVEAMRQADSALIALALTQPPSGPDGAP